MNENECFILYNEEFIYTVYKIIHIFFKFKISSVYVIYLFVFLEESESFWLVKDFDHQARRVGR